MILTIVNVVLLRQRDGAKIQRTTGVSENQRAGIVELVEMLNALQAGDVSYGTPVTSVWAVMGW